MDGITNAIRTGFSNYVNFEGNAKRAEYWLWFLFVFVTSLVLSSLDTMMGLGLLGLLFGLGTFLPSLAFLVRRLHDTGKSGWWFLIVFIPVIGFFVLIYFLIQPSK
ncbi:MAG: DUF805 domain-containing protein [Alphaproteobacteria bacterium]|nr:DUF805 domain-containing protein [Alphaproteobacteria bacterium]